MQCCYLAILTHGVSVFFPVAQHLSRTINGIFVGLVCYVLACRRRRITDLGAIEPWIEGHYIRRYRRKSLRLGNHRPGVVAVVLKKPLAPLALGSRQKGAVSVTASLLISVAANG